MKTILIDLDGVLNEYNGEYDENFIPKPRQDVELFLKKLSSQYKLVLFTTRDKYLVSNWLSKYNLSKYFDNVTNQKVPAWLIIDDRCVNFNGNYDFLLNQIADFKPWYRSSS